MLNKIGNIYDEKTLQEKFNFDELEEKEIKIVENGKKPSVDIKSLFIVKQPIPEPFFEEKIIKIFLEKINPKEEIKILLKSILDTDNIFIKKIKKELTIKNNTKNKPDKLLFKITKEKTLLGRKKKHDTTHRIHDKYSPDNIINKIKSILKKYLIIFVNNIIYSLYNRKELNQIFVKYNLPNHKSPFIIKDLDYKSIVNMKRKKENLDLLQLSVKEFLSKNISSKYRSLQSENLSQDNKSIIETLSENENNKNIFIFVFNELKIEDWLDIFIHQKNLNDFPSFNNLESNQAAIIKNSLVRICDFLDYIKDDKNYFFCFILLIYNYKRYYLIKRERKKKKENRKIK